MSLNVTQEGAQFICQLFLSILEPEQMRIHLFGAPVSPMHTDTLALYQAHELVAPGYAPIALGLGSPPWTTAPSTYGAQFSHTTVVWTLTGAANIYGYFLTDDAPYEVSVWSEIFPAPYVYGAGGGGFGIQLVPNLISCFFPEPLC